MEYYGIKNHDGRDIELAMQELWLGGEVLPVGARLVARHVFESAEDAPLEVIYSFMLPRDAAMRQFRIEGEGFSVRSDLEAVEQAEATYEEAMEDGYLAGMTRNYGDGVTHLMVGNLQPGKRVSVHLEILAGVEGDDDGFRFRFPFTIAPAYHPEARTVLLAPGEAEMELPEEKFGDVLLPPWRQDASGLHRVGFDLAVAVPGRVAMVQSPSHAVSVTNDAHDRCRVALATEGDVPNRDLVIDVKLKEPKSLLWAAPVDGGRNALAAWIPSRTFGEPARMASRTVFVVDRSGSMGGEPIEQARRALRACLGALSPEDSFNIIAFDHEIDPMHEHMMSGDRSGRDMAERFLDGTEARGGTELENALVAAANLNRESGGDLFLLTDGQVFETESMIASLKGLGMRVHVLGIGSASQDRFLSQLARQTGGNSRFLTPRERVDRAAVELFASISSPVAEGLEARLDGKHGRIEPAPPSTIFAGSPVIMFGDAQEVRDLALRWTRDGKSQSLALADWQSVPRLGETLRLLRGSRLISDLEAQTESPPASRKADQRARKRLLARLEKLSREYGLASRAMSLVAVVETEQDQSGKLANTRVVPLGMPEDTSFDAYFGMRRQGSTPRRTRFSATRSLRLLSEPPELHFLGGVMERMEAAVQGMKPRSESPGHEPPAEQEEDLLLLLAALIGPDGGLPGDDVEARLVATLLALLAFVSQGHTPTAGTYGRHVTRLLSFLESASPSPDLPEPPGTMARRIVRQPVSWPDWEDHARVLVGRGRLPTAREFGEILRNLGV